MAGHAKKELTVGVFLRSVKSSKKMMKAAVVPKKRRLINGKREECVEKPKVHGQAPNASSLRLEESALCEGTVVNARSRDSQWNWLKSRM